MEKKTTMMRLPDVMNAFGCSRSSLYNYIEQGLMTKAVHMGRQNVAWPDYEVQALIAERIAGGDDDAIRALVVKLHENRLHARRV